MDLQIWVVTENGIPRYCAWARVKTQDEEPDPALKSIAAALTDTQLTADGWDAFPTAWANPPNLARIGVIDGAGASPTLVGNSLTVGGCVYDISESGPGAMPPDPTISSTADAVALAESLGRDLEVTEKATGKKVKIYASEPGDPLGGGAVDSGIYRRTSDSVAVRADA